MIATKDKQIIKIKAAWHDEKPEPLNRRGKPYMIPRYYIDPEHGLTDLKKYPKRVIGDTDMTALLQASKQSLHRWKIKGIIPFQKGAGARPAYSYNVKDVVEALENYGYFRDEE